MKRIFIFTFALFISLSLSAQDNTIRLTVSGEGATKEEATANALRSAIEQAFGTFVSANTQILNDDIVKDEIATISSGNIQEYTELGCITMPDGHKSVSLSATVSIGNLISYAKSKGSSAEFAGAVFAMNMKMRKLNAENETKAIDHMLQQLNLLAKDMFDIKVEVEGQPKLIDFQDYNNQYRDGFSREISTADLYSCSLVLKYYPTPIGEEFKSLLYNTLTSLALTKEELTEFRSTNYPVYALGIRNTDEYAKFETPLFRLKDSTALAYYKGKMDETLSQMNVNIYTYHPSSRGDAIRMNTERAYNTPFGIIYKKMRDGIDGGQRWWPLTLTQIDESYAEILQFVNSEVVDLQQKLEKGHPNSKSKRRNRTTNKNENYEIIIQELNKYKQELEDQYNYALSKFGVSIEYLGIESQIFDFNLAPYSLSDVSKNTRILLYFRNDVSRIIRELLFAFNLAQLEAYEILIQGCGISITPECWYGQRGMEKRKDYLLDAEKWNNWISDYDKIHWKATPSNRLLVNGGLAEAKKAISGPQTLLLPSMSLKAGMLYYTGSIEIILSEDEIYNVKGFAIKKRRQ